MALKDLSDDDLNRLYNDSKAGIRRGTDYVDNDGDDKGGYTRTDFYSGQSMSSDHYRGGYDEDELMGLSNMYRENVFQDYKGGRLGEEDIRKGFADIYDEKERRRAEKYDQSAYGARLDALENAPKPEASKPEEPTELSDTAKAALGGDDSPQTEQQTAAYDFKTKKMEELTNTPDSETTELPTENPNTKNANIGNIEDYSFNARGRAKSYDPASNADPISGSYMEGFKDSVKSKTQKAGLPTRGPKARTSLTLNFNGGE